MRSRNPFSRLHGVNRLFGWTVLAPTAAAIVYFSLIASDVFVSESRFVVRSPQRVSQTSVMGALLQGTGFSRAQDDTYPVIDYIQSRDALRELNANGYVANAFNKRGDFISRLARSMDNSFEGLWKYYNKHVVSTGLDATSGITTLEVRAYTAEEATTLNERLLQLSERLVNQMNQRAAADTVRLTQQQVDAAVAKAKDAAVALARYRNSHTVFDPDRQSALQLQQIAGLQAQLLANQTQLAQLQAISPLNPQISALKSSIATLEKQIREGASDVTGGKNSLAGKAAEYARLQLDAQLADKQLAAAVVALETARTEAEKKQLYLERLVQPNRPDVAIEPRRLRGIVTAFILGMVLWATLSLLLTSIREHRD